MIRPAVTPAFELHPDKDGTTVLTIRGFASPAAASAFLRAMLRASVLSVTAEDSKAIH